MKEGAHKDKKKRPTAHKGPPSALESSFERVIEEPVLSWFRF
jgi:hypothetical protein